MILYSIFIDTATVKDRWAVSIIRRDADGESIVYLSWLRSVRATDAVRATMRLFHKFDESQPTEGVRIVAGCDRTGDAGTAEMIEDALREEKFTRRIPFRRVWWTTGDGETKPKSNDKTDPHRTKWSVGKDGARSILATALLTDGLRMDEATGDGVQPFAEELPNLTRVATANGAKIGNLKGKHDDLFSATGGALWLARSKGMGGNFTTSVRQLFGLKPKQPNPAPAGEPTPAAPEQTTVQSKNDAAAETLLSGFNGGRATPEQLKRVWDRQNQARANGTATPLRYGGLIKPEFSVRSPIVDEGAEYVRLVNLGLADLT